MIIFPHPPKQSQDGSFTLESYRVIDLRNVLRQKQQSPTGSKQELIKRLIDNLTNEEMYEMLIYNDRHALRTMSKERLIHLLTHAPQTKAPSPKQIPLSSKFVSQAMRAKSHQTKAKQSRITTPKPSSWVSAKRPSSDRSPKLSIGYRKHDVHNIATTLNACSITTEVQARKMIKRLCDQYPSVRCVPRKTKASKVAAGEVGFNIPPPPPPPPAPTVNGKNVGPLDLQKGKSNLQSKKIKVCLPGEIMKGGMCVKVQGPIGVDVGKMLASGMARIRKDVSDDRDADDNEDWD